LSKGLPLPTGALRKSGYFCPKTEPIEMKFLEIDIKIK
jgi:hypothetical protein